MYVITTRNYSYLDKRRLDKLVSASPYLITYNKQSVYKYPKVMMIVSTHCAHNPCDRCQYRSLYTICPYLKTINLED